VHLRTAREAVAEAGIEWTPELRERTAIITGSCVGGQSTEDLGFVEVYKLNHNRVHPLTIPKTMANAGASLASPAPASPFPRLVLPPRTPSAKPSG
jgi:nodulation protein E